MTSSPEFEQIVEDFELLDDWEERYRHVIELGRAMEPLPERFKVPEYKVEGCVSQVWIVPEVRENGAGEPCLFFQGDSDAMIVRGLIAVLRALYSGQPLDRVLAIDAEAELARLDLDQHLSAQRSNGLRAMVRRIREIAGAAAPA